MILDVKMSFGILTMQNKNQARAFTLVWFGCILIISLEVCVSLLSLFYQTATLPPASCKSRSILWQ
jgi:uncharacterized Rmd1/YagE family protein